MKRTTTIVLGCLLLLSACQKRARTVSLPPSPPRAASVPVANSVEAAPAPSPVVMTLESANHAFETGNYLQAARYYESYLRRSESDEFRDAALFRLGLIYASPETPIRDWVRATAFLRQLVSDFPGSPLKAPADLILSLYSEVAQLRADTQTRDQRIKQLSTELENLKKIDAQRRKK